MSKHHTICPFCEATCGLDVTLADGEVRSVCGNREDVFSHGYICPKAHGLMELQADGDRLRRPCIRDGSRWQDVSWEEAFNLIASRLQPIRASHGSDAVALYLGNPNVHNLSGQLYNAALRQALQTRNVYTASTLDQMPKHLSSALLFGEMMSIPVPDVDRTDYFLIL
ncbi:MAG: molybdopterin-dependent oxidoreductase, partial [Candidatus Xenobia bacterium]